MPRTVNDNQGKKELQILLAIGCCSPTNSTQVFFAVSLCLFLTTSTLLVSDYKQRDSLALRQAVSKLPLNWHYWDSQHCDKIQSRSNRRRSNELNIIISQIASLPSFEAPAFFDNLPPFTSLTSAARETLVQVG